MGHAAWQRFVLQKEIVVMQIVARNMRDAAQGFFLMACVAQGVVSGAPAWRLSFRQWMVSLPLVLLMCCGAWFGGWGAGMA